MNQANNPVEELVTETRAAFETETTVGRILERTKKSLERFLANPASLDHVKDSLARVLARKSIPYGQPVDQDGYGSWRLYSDPNHLFCIRPTHQRSTTSRQPHDHGELGWAVYGILVGAANLPAYRRWQRTGAGQVAPLAAGPPEGWRGRNHSGRRAPCHHRPDGKLERSDPQPGDGEPMAQLVRRGCGNRRAKGFWLRLSERWVEI